MCKNRIESKDKLLEREIEKMLTRENPVEGVYPMYGDHPSEKSTKGFSPQNTNLK